MTGYYLLLVSFSTVALLACAFNFWRAAHGYL